MCIGEWSASTSREAVVEGGVKAAELVGSTPVLRWEDLRAEGCSYGGVAAEDCAR